MHNSKIEATQLVILSDSEGSQVSQLVILSDSEGSQVLNDEILRAKALRMTIKAAYSKKMQKQKIL